MKYIKKFNDKKIIDANNPNMINNDDGGNPSDYYIEDDLLE